MKCTECKYCIEMDYGYSNYTVEGTEVDCLLGKNPKFPEDRFYGEEPSLDFAQECDRFIAGESVQVDCDQEEGGLEEYSDDEHVIDLLRSYTCK